ncbi:unnamed protein product [Sphagnum balticum]
MERSRKCRMKRLRPGDGGGGPEEEAGRFLVTVEAVAMAFAQELKRTVVMGAVLAVAVGAIGAQAQPQASPSTTSQSGAAPESLLSSLVAPVVVSIAAFFASFAL